jgi:hypothetical protein
VILHDQINPHQEVIVSSVGLSAVPMPSGALVNGWIRVAETVEQIEKILKESNASALRKRHSK